MGKVSIRDWRLEVQLVTLKGEKHYLWKAVGVDGEVLDFYATEERVEAAARQFLEKALEDPWSVARTRSAISTRRLR